MSSSWFGVGGLGVVTKGVDMDILKKRIAYQIREQVRMLDNKVLSDGTKLEVINVDDLRIQVRARDVGGYPRYFLVKVSEQL